MKARTLLAFLIACLAATPAWAQPEKVVEETKVHPNDEIVIQLEGRVTIETWSGETLKVEAAVEEKGRTVGFTNKDKRGAYALQLDQGDGHVVVRPKARPNLYTVGINWYREHVEHRVWVPVGANVRFQVEEADVTLRGAFYTVVANVEKGQVNVVVPEGDVRVLQSSTTHGSVVVDGEHRGDAYQTIGSGERVYLLATERGEINIQRHNRRL